MNLSSPHPANLIFLWTPSSRYKKVEVIVFTEMTVTTWKSVLHLNSESHNPNWHSRVNLKISVIKVSWFSGCLQLFKLFFGLGMPFETITRTYERSSLYYRPLYLPRTAKYGKNNKWQRSLRRHLPSLSYTLQQALNRHPEAREITDNEDLISY
jgi:hypothetical protein